MDTTPQDLGERFLRLPEVMQKIGLSKSAIWAMQAKGTFPRAVRLARKAVAWRLSDVNRWMNDRPSA